MKLETTGYKSIWFCFNLTPRSHNDVPHFRKTNWLPVEITVELSLATSVFKYRNYYFNVLPSLIGARDCSWLVSCHSWHVNF